MQRRNSSSCQQQVVGLEDILILRAGGASFLDEDCFESIKRIAANPGHVASVAVKTAVAEFELYKAEQLGTNNVGNEGRTLRSWRRRFNRKTFSHANSGEFSTIRHDDVERLD